MLITLILIFTLTALLGLTLLYYVLSSKETPKGIALIHGTFAVIGIVLLIVYVFSSSPSPYISLIFFILAAMGGSLLIYRDITGKGIPKLFALGHGTFALCGLISLLLFFFK